MSAPLEGAVDRHPWRAAAVLALVTIALGMGYSMLLVPWLKGIDQWWIAPDVWVPMRAAHYVANGALGYVYESNEFLVNLPGLPIVLSPLAWFGDRHHLGESIPTLLARPSMWPYYGPLGMGMSVLVFRGARALGVQLGLAGRRWTDQVALVGLVALPVGAVYGHFEDLLALAAVLGCARLLLTPERAVSAAFVLSLGIACKQWAVLAVPLVVVLAPAGGRRRVAVAALALPGALAAFTLAVDWQHASAALLKARTYPMLGHAAPWASRDAVLVGSPFRAAVFPAAALVAWRVRGRRSPEVVLAAFAAVFLSRILFEPVVYAYYLAPALAFCLLHERLTTGGIRRTAVLGTALMAFFPLHPPHLLWWAGALALAVPLFAPLVGEVVRARRGREVPPPLTEDRALDGRPTPAVTAVGA